MADRYVLTAAETEMLGQACRTADELDRLERAVRALPELTTTGSTGQIKPHPLLAEVRAHRLLLERLTPDTSPHWAWLMVRYEWAKAHPNDYRLGGDVLDMLRERRAYKRGLAK